MLQSGCWRIYCSLRHCNQLSTSADKRLWVSSRRDGELSNNEDKVRELCCSCYCAPCPCHIAFSLCYCIYHVVLVTPRFIKWASESLKYCLQKCLYSWAPCFVRQNCSLVACLEPWGKRDKCFWKNVRKKEWVGMCPSVLVLVAPVGGDCFVS